MRDKNKLKKMLALLSVGVVGLTPIATVVSCGGTTQKDNNNNDNGGNDNDNQNDAVEISTIKDKLQTLVDSRETSSWTPEELKSEEIDGQTLTQLGIQVSTTNSLQGISTEEITEHFAFTGDGTIYDGSIDIDHTYDEVTIDSVEELSIINDDLTSLLNSKTNEEWEIPDLLNQKLGGDSDYKNISLSELGITVQSEDYVYTENNKEDWKPGIKNYTFSVETDSKYFKTDSENIVIKHNINISILKDTISSWLDDAFTNGWTNEDGETIIKPITEPDNWINEVDLGNTFVSKAMSDVWPHGLNSLGFNISKAQDSNGNDCLKITFASDKYNLGFNTSSDDDATSYILYIYTLASN